MLLNPQVSCAGICQQLHSTIAGREGFIWVAMNYRLGPLDFLSGPTIKQMEELRTQVYSTSLLRYDGLKNISIFSVEIQIGLQWPVLRLALVQSCIILPPMAVLRFCLKTCYISKSFSKVQQSSRSPHIFMKSKAFGFSWRQQMSPASQRSKHSTPRSCFAPRSLHK